LTPDFLDQMLSAAEDPFYGSYMTNSMRANGLPLKKHNTNCMESKHLI